MRKTWPMANLEDNIDMVEGAKFISVPDVQSAYRQVPVHPDHVETAAFVINSCRHRCNRRLFGVFNARGFSQKWLMYVGPYSRVAHKYGRSLRFIHNLGESFEIVRKHICSVASSWSHPEAV